MRILYGINSQGQGHFSKAAVLVPILEARGHEVRVVSSGPTPPKGYQFTWHRHYHGLEYVIADGKTSYGQTFRKWSLELPRLSASLWKVRSLARRFDPELVITDFEPLTASPIVQPRCETIAISRQVALFDRSIPLPETMPFEKKITRTAIRLFTCGADRRYGYHYEPASFRCVPPVIRPEIRDLQPELGEHLFVYNHFGDAQELIDWASRCRQPVVAYGFPQVPRGRQGWVEFRKADRVGLLEDLRTSRGVITTAGLTTPIEAFLLGKPVCVVPIPNQWEQLVNAFHLEQAGLARHSETWNYDLLLDLPAPTREHPLYDWLSTPAERIIDHLIDDEPTVEPVPAPFRVAA